MLGLAVTALTLPACNGLSLGHRATGPAQTVLASERSPYGTILATGSGHTLYDFAIDSSSESRCPSGPCTVSWPPLLVKGRVVTRGAAQSSLVGEINRPGGARQVTYGGHPLYTYTEDSDPHQTSGQALNQFGAPWYVITVSGQQVTRAAPGASS